MKKSRILLPIVLVMISFSCEKSYNCYCEMKEDNHLPKEENITFYANSKSKAKEECENGLGLYDTEMPKTNCELK